MNLMFRKIVLIIGILSSALIIMFMSITAGKNSEGLEGDEVFTYISSSSLGGYHGICFLQDQTWYDSDYFADALTSTQNERFNITMVVENQTQDTHPPLYYIFMNFICSIFQGQYSKWFGIGLNIFLMLIVNLLLYILLDYFAKNKVLSLICSSIFCCSYFAIEMTLFIRMYVLFMAIMILQAYLHFATYDKLSAEEKINMKNYLSYYSPIVVVTLVGALTHYYFLVSQSLLAFIFILGLFLQKKYKSIWLYICSMILSGGIYILLYPAAINHLFFKYRGRDAIHKFLKETSILGETGAMLANFNKDLYKGMFLWIIALLGITTIVLLFMKKINRKTIIKGCIFAIPMIVYFIGITKASPFVATRYISPIAPLVFVALIIWGKSLMELIFHRRKQLVGVAIIIIVFITTFYFGNRTFKPAYLAERDEIVQELAQNTDYCIYVSGDKYNWKMWEDYVNYPQFEALYFIDGHEKLSISDEKILQMDNAVIYVDTSLDYDETIKYLSQYCAFDEYSNVYTTQYTYIVSAKSKK